MLKHRTANVILGLLLFIPLTMGAVRASAAPRKQPAAKAKPRQPAAPQPPIKITWYTDYAEATRAAQSEGRMLFIYFYVPREDRLGDRFERETLADPRVRRKLQGYIAAKLPADTSIVVDGKPVRLLDHVSFHEMEGQPGIAVLDYAHPRAPQYGRVVSAVPINGSGAYQYQPRHLSVLLDLPAGTVTQRTLIFAVHIHPEGPKSVQGQLDQALAQEAQSHSSHQARIRNQGHHSWGGRFQRISGRLPWGLRAQEIVAESWPHQRLLDAAIDVVASWRQSSGHWGAVRRWQPRYGYDMKRGSNGIWYATGLFGNHN